MVMESGSSSIEWAAVSPMNGTDQTSSSQIKDDTPDESKATQRPRDNAVAASSSSIAELMMALKKDQELLAESYAMLSNEKKMRDEKEVALTEQIDLLNNKIVDKEEELSRTVGARTTLEIQVETMKHEMSVLITKLDTVQRSYTQEITRLEKNLREVRREQEKRLSDVSYEHFKECEEMRRKLFHSQLEGDRYKLGKEQMTTQADVDVNGSSPPTGKIGEDSVEPTVVVEKGEPEKKRRKFIIFLFFFRFIQFIIFLCMLVLSAASIYYVSARTYGSNVMFRMNDYPYVLLLRSHIIFCPIQITSNDCTIHPSIRRFMRLLLPIRRLVYLNKYSAPLLCPIERSLASNPSPTKPRT